MDMDDPQYPPPGPDIPAVESGEFADYDEDPTVGPPGVGVVVVDPRGDDD